MDYLAPPLRAALHVQLKIKSGVSMQMALQSYVRDFPDCPFAKQTSLWLFCRQSGQVFEDKLLAKQIYRKTLLSIFARGLKGEPVLHILQDFQQELKDICMQHLEQQIQKLPFLTFIPLFLFQVPAFLLLLLAPLILDLIHQLM